MEGSKVSVPMPLRSLLVSAVLALGSLPGLAGAQVEGVVLPFRQVDVSAPVSSRVVDMKVKEGDAVKEGQPLAQLYGKLEELEMQRAKALLERREFEAKGAKRLFDNKIIPEAKALESRIDLDLARMQFETAQEQVRLRTILAPMDGVVVERLKEVGEAVLSAQPIFRILDLSKVYVQCSVSPEALARFVPGQKVQVRIPQMEGAPSFPGEVTLVDPCANGGGRFRVKVLVNNPEHRIRAGLRATVETTGSR